MLRNLKNFSFITIILSIAAFSSAVCQTSGYKLLNTIPVGGESKWDYIAFDGAHNRLFVSHSDRVTVISGETDKIMGEILHTDGVHGIVIAPELNRGFTSNGKSNSATIFDATTFTTLDSVAVGTNPDCILYEPATKRVFTFNGKSSDATVLDAASGKVIGTIALGGKPEFATCDSAGLIYDALESTNEVLVIDAKTMNITHRYKIGKGTEPSGVALDNKNNIHFIGCSNEKMIIMNASNGEILATLPTGKGTDACAFDPVSKLAFSSNGEGTLTIVKEQTRKSFKVVENLKTLRGARTLALDYAHDIIYLPTAQYEEADKSAPNARPKSIPNTMVILKYGR